MTKTEALRQMSCPLAGRAAELETILNMILAAGFEHQNPYFRLFDENERPWPMLPWEMSVGDILEFIERCYGLDFARAVSVKPEFKLH